MSKDIAALEALMKAAYKRITALEAEVTALRTARPEPIAIIGLGCRLPGAENVDQFWQLLLEGRDAVTTPAPTRWPAAPEPQTAAPQAGFLAQIDHFDPLFFRIAPREAAYIDPEQRLLLEVTWEALEQAGIPPHTLVNSPTGVFIGQIAGVQQVEVPAAQPATLDATDQAGLLYAMTGSLSGFAPGRLSYFLGTQGPSMAIDCSCSAALMSVHLAVNSLRRGECSLAIAGGVHLLPAPDVVAGLTAWQLLTADGRCKTFDAAADGYGLGEGCGIVILKRLSDAQRDGDPLLAVVRGSATNHDGPSSGLTVPNGLAQQAVVRQALADAGVAPQAVGYLEANGIGTPLGDAMEVEALGQVFGQRTEPLWLGAVAPNIGHLDAAAGMPALIKAVLALLHGEIPPNLHFHTPSPLIDWDTLPLRVPTTRTPWRVTSRIAGVSSFGLSGANVHLVLSAAPADEPAARSALSAAPEERPCHVLALSAKSEPALQVLATRYADYLAAHPETNIADLCYTANVGRSHFHHRVAVVTATGADLPAALAAVAAGQRKLGISRGKAPETRPKIAFLCSGLGAQAVDMGRQLYDTQPSFRQALTRCDEILRPYLAQSLLDVIYPNRTGQPASPHAHDPAFLQRSLYAETALFAVEYALAQLWRAWGIEPDVVLGHSVGEYVAACLAGVISLEDALKLVAERARLIETASVNGATAVLFADQPQVAALLENYADQVTLAGVNSPNEILIAGLAEEVDAVLAAGRQAGVDGRRLTVAHAAHSPRMEPILDEFAQIAATVTYQAPQCKLISSVNGQVCQQIDAAYWHAHLRQPVRFDQSIQTLQTTDCTLIIEIGPQPVLLWLGRQNWTGREDVQWLASLRAVQTDWQQLLQSVSELYVQGAPVNWSGIDQGYLRRKVALPTYPFQRQRFALPTISPASRQPPVASDQSPATSSQSQIFPLTLPGLPLTIEAFHLRQLPTTSDEWWYQAKQGAQGQWDLRIFDGNGHCIAETKATAQPQATMDAWPVQGKRNGQQPLPHAASNAFAVDPTTRTRLLGNQKQQTLPNGWVIAHLNPYETAYLYNEIFIDRCYLKHGITLQKGDTVVDVGANIGLFTLFVQQEAPGAQVYAFEPSPAAFQALQSNVTLYLPQAKVFNCGVAEHAQTATFTFYQNSSVFSSFYADPATDQAAIRTVVENMVRAGQKDRLDPTELAQLVDELMADRLASQSLTCQLYALSDIIQAEQIDQIDLLKIDAEKSEVAILRGIRAADWPKIKQIVIEVHEQDGARLPEVTTLLRQQGFTCAVEEETFLHQSGLYNIFATRAPAATLRQNGAAPTATQAQPLALRQQLQQATPEAQKTLLVGYLRAVIGQIAGIAGDRLEAEQTLLTLGVDSLLAIEIRNQIKQTLAITLPIATVLENSIATLALLLRPPADDAPRQSSAEAMPVLPAADAPGETALPVPATFQDIEGEL